MIFQALVLAGGAGARFGGGKLISPWRGGALIDGALAAAFAAPVAAVTVVTGADEAAVEQAVRAFAARAGQTDRLTLVHAADHAEGMAATLRRGVASLPPQTDGVLVFLGDMPLIPLEILAPLVAALATGRKKAAAPLCGGRRGHPAALSRQLFDDILSLGGDQGARRILDGLGEDLALVPTRDDGVLVDVDRPSDVPD